MKTDDLVKMLGTHVEPVKDGQLRSTLLMALGMGAAVVICLLVAFFGAPDDAFGGEYLGVKLVALVFTLGLVTAGTSLLLKAARPGTSARWPLAVIGLLFFALLLAAAVTFAFGHPAAWHAMVFGPQWAACLLCIPLFAAAPFASLIWALRKDAPTNLARTGAIAGMVAGAVGAAAYTLHQPASSIPFIMFWYGGAIAVCALAGAILGPRLLRW